MARATVAVISIGDMGLGVAKLLVAHDYKVITNVSGRSQATHDRASKNSIALVSTDAELCEQANYILSIVPPRDAYSTAQRIANAHEGSSGKPLCYIDLNAISPRSARQIDELFKSVGTNIKFIDGGIIGGPAHVKPDGSWYRPSVPVSGPLSLQDQQPDGARLAEILNVKHVDGTIGAATGLKMCFAAVSKGLTALAIQSFTTAHNLNVLPHLQAHLEETFPELGQRVSKGLVGMPPKAYRWVREMDEIADTFREDGGFTADEDVFSGIAKVYKLVADGSELGRETTENRGRGKTPQDVALLMSQSTQRRRAQSL